MKVFRPALILAATLCAAAFAHADDAELTRKLIGTWDTDPAGKSAFVSTATYKADGTGTELVHLRDHPESTGVQITTQWSIKDSVLSLKSTSSSDPQRIPIGIELKDRIISITNDHAIIEALEGYGSAKGTQMVEIRRK